MTYGGYKSDRQKRRETRDAFLFEKGHVFSVEELLNDSHFNEDSYPELGPLRLQYPKDSTTDGRNQVLCAAFQEHSVRLDTSVSNLTIAVDIKNRSKELVKVVRRSSLSGD